jgi:hypothetical protein
MVTPPIVERSVFAFCLSICSLVNPYVFSVIAVSATGTLVLVVTLLELLVLVLLFTKVVVGVATGGETVSDVLEDVGLGFDVPPLLSDPLLQLDIIAIRRKNVK